jgi:hypothetical protein
VCEDEEEEDDELEWFEHAHCFGVTKTMDVQAEAEHADTGQVCEANDPGPSSTSASFLAPIAVIHELYDKPREDMQARQAVQTHSQLPRLLSGMGGAAATHSAEGMELDERARKAFRTIKLPGAFKPRYYMTNQEIQWATSVYAECMLAARGAKGDKHFFERLYQWGVYTDMLSDDCSPSGLKSLGKRLFDAHALAGDPPSRNEIGLVVANTEGGVDLGKDEADRSAEREEIAGEDGVAGEEAGEGEEQGKHSGGEDGGEGEEEEEELDEQEEVGVELHSGGEYGGEGEEEEEELDEQDEVGDEPMGDIMLSIERATDPAELEALVRHAKELGDT